MQPVDAILKQAALDLDAFSSAIALAGSYGYGPPLSSSGDSRLLKHPTGTDPFPGSA
jgi:hypothetical protein